MRSARVDSGRILSVPDPDPESTICKKTDAEPELLYNPSGSRSLFGHFLYKIIGKFRLDRWLAGSEQESDSQICEISGLQPDRCQAKFLTSHHVRMHRAEMSTDQDWIGLQFF